MSQLSLEDLKQVSGGVYVTGGRVGGGINCNEFERANDLCGPSGFGGGLRIGF